MNFSLKHSKNSFGNSPYEEPSYDKAKARILAVRKELGLINESAVRSLDEGVEETLTLHRLGVFKKLGRSFKTTNCLESVNRQLEMYTGRVCRRRNSNQRQRWVVSVLLEIEPSLRKVNGYKHLMGTSNNSFLEISTFD